MKIFLKTNLTILFLVIPIFSQQVFIEPELGVFKPKNGFDYFPRFGGNIGLALKYDIQIYAGYKLWSGKEQWKTELETVDSHLKFNTVIIGTRKIMHLKSTDLGLRFGVEYIISDASRENDRVDSIMLIEAYGKGSGFSIEGGAVYDIKETISVFAGINYLINDFSFEEFSFNGEKFSRQDVGLSSDETSINMDGINYKLSISISIGGH